MAKGKKAIGCASVIGGFFVIAVISALVNGGNSENVERTSVPLDNAVVTSKTVNNTTRVTYEKIVTQSTTKATTEKPQTEPPAPKETEAKTYWLNTESGKYHKQSCRTIKDGTTESYWQSTTDIDWLKANFDACGVCHPY